MLDEGVGRPKDVVEAARADGGLWALHVAAGNEQMEVCRYLVQELRVDVNAADDKGLLTCSVLFLITNFRLPYRLLCNGELVSV
jgi:hypothetical protein